MIKLKYNHLRSGASVWARSTGRMIVARPRVWEAMGS
jgi:hypothetical protein